MTGLRAAATLEKEPILGSPVALRRPEKVLETGPPATPTDRRSDEMAAEKAGKVGGGKADPNVRGALNAAAEGGAPLLEVTGGPVAAPPPLSSVRKPFMSFMSPKFMVKRRGDFGKRRGGEG